MKYTDEEQLLLMRINEMDQQALEAGIVPIRDVIDILGSRWKVEILTGVARGHHRFSELNTFLYDISEKMLASGLRQLTELQLIERTDRFGYTNRAEYHITHQGLMLFNIIFAMQEWGEGYRKELFGGEKHLPSGE